MHVPVHNHTEFSNLDGLSTPDEIAARCVDLGCPCCGITDHGVVSGHLEFDKAMRKNGIKPIFGCEFYHGEKTTFKGQERDQDHFVVGALTDEGLKNLWRLADDAAPNFRFVSRVTFDMMVKRSEGLFATSACIQGKVGVAIRDGGDPYEPLNRYLEIFRDNFFLEIHTYPGPEHEYLNKTLVQIGQERGIPLIYADDAHFAFPEQYEVHDAYVARQTGQNIYTPIEERKMWHPKTLYIKSEDEIREALSYLPETAVNEALINSVDLGNKVDAKLPEVRRHLPAFIPGDCPWLSPEQKESSAEELFIELVEDGLIRRYGEDAREEVWDRAKKEMTAYLDTSQGIKLYDYILMAWDLKQYCEDVEMETGPGRGSSAGSIVCYALGITDVCPLKYDLIFERFWNPGRAKGFPDIDSDFPRAERRNILKYLEKRWGEDRVRVIGNIARMKPKDVIKKTYKACGMTAQEWKELNAIIDQVPDLDIHGADAIGWAPRREPGKTIYVMQAVGDQIIEWVESLTPYRQDFALRWLELLEAFCSRVGGYGVHASGIVVCDEPLAPIAPCRWSRDQDIRVTMFGMDDIEKLQLIKLDVLGLRTLDTLTEWKRIMAEKGVNINWSGLEDIVDNQEMWELFDQGLTLGLFQIEDGYARHLCKQIKPRSIEDLGAIVALNRPGPIRSGAADDFMNRRNDPSKIEYDAEMLRVPLEPTYGLFVYQEQVIAFFESLGLDKSDADAVRKILGKKKPEEMAKLKIGDGEWEGKGYEELARLAGIVDKTARIIWDKLEGFASYSFNKSHAIAYGLVTWRTTFAKYFGPAEYLLACIRTNPDDAGEYVAEARRMGIAVSPPDILVSNTDVSDDEDGNIFFGLSNVKNVGVGTARYIIKLRDKYGEQIATREGLETALAEEKVEWEAKRDKAKEALKPFKVQSPNQIVKSNVIDSLEFAGAFDNYEERMVTLQQKQKLEKEYLHVVVTDESRRVFLDHEPEISECDTYEEVNAPYPGEDCKFRIPGIVTKIQPTKTKADQRDMAIITIEYESDECRFAVFPDQWSANRFLFKEYTPGIFTVRHSKNKKTGRTGYNFETGRRLS